MLLDIARVRHHLKDFDLRTLFIEELGWEHHRQELVIPVDGQDFRLHAIAHKRGLIAFHCVSDAAGRIPSYPTRRKIETQVTKSVNQHLIIYTDAANTQQVWQWVKRGPGKPAAAREQSFSRDQTGEALIQKLNIIAFSLGDEENIGGIVQVAERVRAGFDVERVTRRFYEQFKAEHAAFLKFLSGIPDEGLQRWYVSVMLNRLMFIYFIQKKGFLDGDPNYLRTRLAASQAAGADRYYTDFLCPLFFEGFARRPEERSTATSRLLGQVPYLNGGIFERHQIETAHGQTIRVPDAAFERLFGFFDAYHWHLDERPLRADNEINPDVLGYIFEKYINQKQMGAYYTKDDITGYISQNTIIPYLFDAARRACRVAFEGEHSVWDLLAADPDRYIYPAVRYGADLPLPAEIAAGLTDVSRRDGWNRPAPAEYALPTEIWREVVARRQRYAEVKSAIRNGTIRNANDLITLNLDIRQFAQDVIAECEGPELLRAFWQAIESVTILDPTVGSGAFLFAALNVLEPLYEGCLERMQAFIDDEGRLTTDEGDSSSVVRRSSQKYSDFRKVLARVAQHANRRYFILKSIAVNNLYGVDIMEEAVEICKLRLFLKLVAQVARVEDVEPLPDIDFNVRAGNTLVGYTTREDVERALSFTGEQGKLLFPDELAGMQRFEERAADVERLFGLFRQQQTDLGGQVTAGDKAELRRRLDALSDELNRALARDYGVDAGKLEYDAWLVAHRPLHWFVEFYGIMRRGGFDVVIGNPPWVEYRTVSDDYEVRGFETRSCSNLWAFVTERSLRLLSSVSGCGLIVPMSLVSTRRMSPVQQLLKARGVSWLSSYESDSNPGQLFDGVKQNISILLYTPSGRSQQFTTRLFRFFSDGRSNLFPELHYALPARSYMDFGFPKIGRPIQDRIMSKLFTQPPLGTQLTPVGGATVYVHRIAHYYIKCFDFTPYFRSDRDGMKKSEDYKEYSFARPIEPIVALLNASVFYFYWQTFFDGFKAGKEAVESFPCAPFRDKQIREALTGLCKELMADMRANSKRLSADYSATGRVEYDQFNPRKSKPILDEIDRILARHYGFTEEELDFIINYDIKYRMGDALEGADDNE